MSIASSSSTAMATIINTDIQYYLTFFLLWLFSTLLLHFVFKKPARSRLPPSPPALPIIGHLHLLSSAFYQSFQQIFSRYGPLLYLRLGSFKCVLISSASLANEMFKIHDVALSGKPPTVFEDKLLFGNAGFFSAPYGDYWKFMKKLCMTELLGTRQILRSRGIRNDELIRFLRKMMEKASKSEIVQLDVELFMLTNNSLCRMAFGANRSAEDGAAEMCRDLVMGFLGLAEKLTVANVLGPFKIIVFWMYQKQLMTLTKCLDEFMDRILEEHEERAKKEGIDGDRKDLVDVLLEVYRDENADVKITMAHIKAFILDLFVAGTSTQADATQWALAELINHPNIFKKAREEIESVVGQSRLVEESDLPSLHYLQAVVKETLRLHAPLPLIPRSCLESFKFGEFDIPKGTMILINAHAMMRDPKLWDNPDEFCPDRFLDSMKEKDNIEIINSQVKGLNFGYIPFGVGRRMCPGSALGEIQVSAILATMIQCFDWEVGGGRDEDGSRVGAKVNMDVGTGITTRMAHPLRCIPKIHFNPFDA